MDDIDQEIDSLEPGRFMDRVAFKMLFQRLQIKGADGRMRKVYPEDVRQIIRQGKDLWGDMKAEDWPAWGRRIKKLKLEPCITPGRFRKEFRERRPDIWEVYLEEPQAPLWLVAQVASLRIHLCIDQPVFRPAKPFTS